jgi:hypothetical protein
LTSARTPAHATPHNVARSEEYSYRDESSRRASVRMITVTMVRWLPLPALRALSRPWSGGAL